MTNLLTKATPKVINGVTFRCYKTGIAQSTWRSDDGRCAAWSPAHRNSHRASVDGVGLKTRFRSLENAMKAAVAVASNEG